jgi:hypothetical protein
MSSDWVVRRDPRPPPRKYELTLHELDRLILYCTVASIPKHCKQGQHLEVTKYGLMTTSCEVVFRCSDMHVSCQQVVQEYRANRLGRVYKQYATIKKRPCGINQKCQKGTTHVL